MKRHRPAAVLAALLLGCSQPPERQAPIPADLNIMVELDGHALPSIDARTLAVAPDIEDEHRVAWRLDRLVPQVARASQLVVEQRDGERIVLPLGEGAEERAASSIALLLNRKGEVVLGALDPEDPFPAFHGRGGNRGRGQQGEERIRDPRWLRLRSRAAERPAAGSGP